VNAVERLSKPIRETLHGRVRTFLERIKAGVFRTALKRNKVLVLLNHNPERVLASTEDGNAILEEDNIGLKADITICDKEVVQKAREGKLSGWSFGFIANDDEMTTEGNDEIRTVTDMELLEVSILDETKSPAYYGTSIESREGGARMVEIRADAFATEGEENPTAENEQKISIDELASLVAAKVIEALKTEEKAEEETDEVEAEAETEEQTETEAEEQTEETAAEEQTETETETEAETEETTEEQTEETTEENRSIDYSAFERRLADLKK
jgi:HK97 family phage prohead protease